MNTYRGHKIIKRGGNYFYCDNGVPVSNDKDRSCGECKKENTIDGHDNCIGELEKVMNACCGHGNDDSAYIQFLDKKCIRGKNAIKYFKKIRGLK